MYLYFLRNVMFKYDLELILRLGMCLIATIMIRYDLSLVMSCYLTLCFDMFWFHFLLLCFVTKR